MQGTKMVKAWYHVAAILKMYIYKMLYRECFQISRGVTWRRNFNVYIEGGNISVGKGCFFNNDCSLASMSSIVIGNDCIFGEGVKIYDHDHIYSKNDSVVKNQGFVKSSVCIGNNCWIGSNAVILKGVTIGDNCVIAAGTIVRQDVSCDRLVYNSGNQRLCEIDIRKRCGNGLSKGVSDNGGIQLF